MASATSTTREVTPAVPAVTTTDVVLTMNEEEALLILGLLGYVAGAIGPRQAVERALRSALDVPEDTWPYSIVTGTVRVSEPVTRESFRGVGY